MTLKTRTKAPAKTDKNYIRWDKGGYNYCMEMSGGSVLPNCTGYAWGRWREILGKFHELSRGNAEVWWGKQDGYERGQTPRIGAAIVWRQGVAGNAADGMGHVAIVEDILPNGDIVTSNSQYYGETFYLKTLKKPYIYKPGFILQGFIYLPIVLDKPKPNVPITPPARPVDTAMVKQDGFFKTDRVVNIRESASTKATIVGKLAKDEEVRYDSYIKTDGHVWVSFMRVGVRVFSAWREINGETFGGCRFATAPAKPTPPAPKTVAKKEYIELIKDPRRYATYEMGVTPVVANIKEKNYLTTPARYEIIGWTNPKVAQIVVNGERRQIFVDSKRAKLIKA